MQFHVFEIKRTLVHVGIEKISFGTVIYIDESEHLMGLADGIILSRILVVVIRLWPTTISSRPSLRKSLIYHQLPSSEVSGLPEYHYLLYPSRLPKQEDGGGNIKVVIV